MSEFGALSLFPPLLAIIVALLSRHVLLSLLSGIVCGELILYQFDPPEVLFGIFERFSVLLGTPWILKTLAFALMVGGVMALLKRSGGIEGFIDLLTHRMRLVNSARGSLLLAYAVGIVIFIESSITSLIAGTVARPLSDRYGVSRAKLAYVCDSTSAPVCSIIVLNGWGALLLGLISTQIGAGLIEGESVSWLLQAVAYNFYAYSALAVTFVVIWFNIEIGPMRHARAVQEMSEERHRGKACYMIVPLIVMVVSVFAVLFITGGGNLLKGSGSSAIFYSQIITLLFMLGYYRVDGGMQISVWAKSTLKGMRSMVTVTVVLLLAFALGNVTYDLHTGAYLAAYASQTVAPEYAAAIIFALASVMAFATGTSWGTFSIMLPIAVALGVELGADVALCIGAVISGGVFGDHCSPISDTTIISSMAAKCDHIEHVNTQLPYALISALIALGFFLLFA